MRQLRSPISTFCILLALLPVAVPADVFGPRISFSRVKPAETNLGSAVVIDVVEFSGANGSMAAEEFASAAEREGFLSIRLPSAARPSPNADIRTIASRTHGADILVRAHADDCISRVGSSKHGSRTEYWIEARCSLQAELFDPTGSPVTAFEITGSATSAHAPAISPDLQREAEENGLRRAAASAGVRISPRHVTESIRLDKEAPRFDEAYRFIQAGQFDRARDLWNGVLRIEDSSPALRYDLAAVCEALGDTAAARTNYEAAIRLDPRERKYGESIELLERRTGEAELLRSKVGAISAPSVLSRTAATSKHKKR